MAILNFIKPKWEHHDPLIRLSAIKELDESDPDLLINIIINDESIDVRQAALSKISQLETLDNLSINPDCSTEIKSNISEKINSIHLDAVLTSPDISQKLLSLSKLDNQSKLAKVAVKAEETDLRLKAVEKINDPNVLIKVLKQNCGKIPGLAAVDKISDPDLLEMISAEGSSKHIRSAALKKSKAIKGPDPELIKAEYEQKLADIIKEANQLASLPDPEIAHEKFLELTTLCKKLEGEKGSDFREQLEKAEKLIETRLTTFKQYSKEEQLQQKKIISQIDQLAEICQKISELLDYPDDKNNDKFNLLVEQWQKILVELKTVPGDSEEEYNNLTKTFINRREMFKKDADSVGKLKKVLEEIESLLDNGVIKKVPAMLSKLEEATVQQKLRFLNTDNINEKIKSNHERYHQVKKAIKEADKQKRKDNLDNRLSLLNEITSLGESENLVEAEKRVIEISKIISNSVDLPSGTKDLSQDFSDAIANFKKVLNEHYEKQDWQQWTNKNLQEKLIQEMEELSNTNDLHSVFKKLKTLQKQWGESGPVPPKYSNALWKQFKGLSDQNFQRCQSFFKELDNKAEQNFLSKLDIIKRAEEQQNSDQWNKGADFFKNLQTEWNAIGRIPKEKSEDELFGQFRQACNLFFDRRKSHYDELDKKREENYILKVQLCEDVKKLADNPEESHNKFIQNAQSEWKKIGPVPKKKEDEIWKKFRGECDRFYQWLDSLRPQNLILKEQLCQNADELFLSIDEKRTNLEKNSREIIKLQKEWKDIGPAPKEVNNEIWRKFRKTCDDFFKVRKDHYAEIDKQRPINETRKKEIIKTVNELAKQNSRKNVETIIKLQDEWKTIGQATRESERHLQQQFKERCNDFFKERRQNFEELDRIRRENLKKKEELCLRLELIAGIKQPVKATGPGKSKSSLTLAEQLKLAFESNFVMSGEQGDNSRRKKDEVKQIQSEWQQISGQVPREHEHYIKNRYKKALDASFGTKKK